MNPKEAVTVPAMPRVISRGRKTTERQITNADIQEAKRRQKQAQGRYCFVYER